MIEGRSPDSRYGCSSASVNKKRDCRRDTQSRQVDA